LPHCSPCVRKTSPVQNSSRLTTWLPSFIPATETRTPPTETIRTLPSLALKQPLPGPQAQDDGRWLRTGGCGRCSQWLRASSAAKAPDRCFNLPGDECTCLRDLSCREAVPLWAAQADLSILEADGRRQLFRTLCYITLSNVLSCISLSSGRSIIHSSY
jgi:hypothetical protein